MVENPQHPVQIALDEVDSANRKVDRSNDQTHENLGAILFGTGMLVAGSLMHKYGVGPELLKAAVFFIGSANVFGGSVIEGFRQLCEEPRYANKRLEKANAGVSSAINVEFMPIAENGTAS